MHLLSFFILACLFYFLQNYFVILIWNRQPAFEHKNGTVRDYRSIFIILPQCGPKQHKLCDALEQLLVNVVTDSTCILKKINLEQNNKCSSFKKLILVLFRFKSFLLFETFCIKDLVIEICAWRYISLLIVLSCTKGTLNKPLHNQTIYNS